MVGLDELQNAIRVIPGFLESVFDSLTSLVEHCKRQGIPVVLWVSRHNVLPAQLDQLMQKLGSNIVVVQYLKPVPNAEFVIKLAEALGAKYIVPVLPLSFIARLVEQGKVKGITILFARMEVVAQVNSMEEARRLVDENPLARTISTYADGTIKVHEFKGFEVIKEVKLVTEPW